MTTLPGARPSPLSQSHGSPARQRCGSLPSTSTGSPGAGSPWRTHVRQHRRNIARARAQLGFGDSEDREDEEEEEKREPANLEDDDDEEKRSAVINQDDDEKEASHSSVPPSPDSSGMGSACEEALRGSDETDGVEVAEVVVQLSSLDLECESNPSSLNDQNPETAPKLPEPQTAPQVPRLPPPPSSIRHAESDSSGSGGDLSVSHFPPITPPHHSSNSCIPSSSLSTPSRPQTPTTPPLDQPSSSSPTLKSTPKPNSTSCLPSSSSAHCLSALSPPGSSSFYKTSSPSTPSLSSISSLSQSQISSSPSTPGLSSTPKQQIFSPFPSVKQPRKSVAARNLGLYGPTSRTPTVHFPQLNRNLNRSCAAGTTGRR